MKEAVVIGSGAVIYISSLIKTGKGNQKLIRGYTRTDAHRQQDDLISLLLFLQNKESSIKMKQMHLEGEFIFYCMLEGFVQFYEHNCRMINLLILTATVLSLLNQRARLNCTCSMFCDTVLTEELYLLFSESGS
jgi:hypothetical protein